MKFNLLMIAVIFLTLAGIAPAQTEHDDHSKCAEMKEHSDHESCPHGKSHAREHAEMNQRGDHVMGFAHETTTHHFLVRKNGGVIEVTANDASDETSVKQIRKHLRQIADEFARGHFGKPKAIHEQVPPGADLMKEMRDSIDYRYEEIPAGARVHITSKEDRLVEAIHSFLRFQIQEHHTGDSHN